MNEQLPVSPSRLIFIGGAPRSGTTLVQRILASHSSVYGGPEFDLVPEIVKLRDAFHYSVGIGRISKYLAHDEVDDLFARFIESTFSYKLAKVPGKTCISEKTPSNVLVFSELAQMFPDAHLVFVLRDPRAVVASMLQVGERYRSEGKKGPDFTRDVQSAVAYINECWAAGSAAVQNHPNVHVVYYEDVVVSPEATIKVLMEKLGMPFEPGMIEMKEYEASESKGDEKHWYSKEKLQAPITADSLDSWRHQINAYQNYLVCRGIAGIPEIKRYDMTAENRLQYRLADAVLAAKRGLRGVLGSALPRLARLVDRILR